MTATDANPAARSDRRNPFRRSVEGEWPQRLATLFLGVALGLLVLNYYYQKRIVPEELALGRGATAAVATWNGIRLNAWRLPDYASVYPESATGSVHDNEVVWLGNSQVHAVNQYREGDTTGPYFAAAELGWPVYALTIPNASLQEHLIITTWILQRRMPEWLLVPIVFDDTREDGLRPDFKELDGPALRSALATSASGRDLVRELERLSAAEKDAQGTTRTDRSLQVIVEDALEGWADRRWDVWAKRAEIFSTFVADLYRIRNRAFGITAKSKRPRIQIRYEKNMQALRELLAATAGAGVKTIVYIPPLRWDVEPPYILEEYEACKADAQNAAREHGAFFVDLDRAVPDEYWGDRFGDIDFMHFQVGGHRILGEELARAIRRAGSGEPASPGSAGGGAH